MSQADAAFKELLSLLRPQLKAFAREAKASLEGKQLTLTFSERYNFHYKNAVTNLKPLQAEASKLGLALVITQAAAVAPTSSEIPAPPPSEVSPSPASPTASETLSSSAPSGILAHPLMPALLEIFGAEVEAVVPDTVNPAEYRAKQRANSRTAPRRLPYRRA